MSLRNVLMPFGEILASMPAVEGMVGGQQVLDLGWIGQAWCDDLVVSAREPDGRQIYARLILQTPADLMLADLGLVALTVPQTGGLIESVVHLKTGSETELAADVPLNLQVRQPLLRRVDPRTGAPLAEGLDLQARASVSVDDSGPRVQLYALSVPAAMIGQTGIIVTLEGVRLLLDDNALPVALRQFAGDGPTRLLASRAELRWLPQFVPALAELPGIAVPLRDVVVDEAGVSFLLEYEWRVTQDAAGSITPLSEMFGSLLNGQFRAALRRVVGEVTRNRPSRFEVEGLVEIPWLPGAAGVSFKWNGAADGAGSVDIALEHPGVRLPVGSGHVEVNQIELSGRLGEESLAVGGRADVAVALPGVAIGPVRSEFAFEGGSERHHLRASLLDVPVGALGQLDRATLEFDLKPGEDAWVVESPVLSTELRWSDLRARLAIANWPVSIPQPPNNARVVAELKWNDPALDLTFRLESDTSTDLWRFLPAGYRPVTRRVELGLSVHFANAATFGTTSPNRALQAEVVLLVEFKPFLPDFVRTNRLLELSVPNADGFVTARASVAVGGTQGDRVDFTISDALALDMFVPFLETENAIVRAEVQSLGMGLVAGTGGTPDRLTLECSGTVSIRQPRFRDNDLLTQALTTLLRPLGEDGIQGTFKGKLETDGSGAGTTLELSGTITESQLDVDLLAVLGAISPSQGAGGTAATFRGELPLDTSVRFVLDGFTLRIEPPAAAGGANVVSAELSVTAEVGGASVSAIIAISSEVLSVGLKAEIPLSVPKFPISRADLNPLARGAGPDWTRAGFRNELRCLDSMLSALDTAPGGNEAARRNARRRRAELSARRQMLVYLNELWEPLDAQGRRTFQQWVEQVVMALDLTKGFTQGASDLELHIENARLIVPWRAPQQIALEGGARLSGFAPDDPFRGLGEVTLGLGLSPDQIYFTLEGTGEPVPIPDFGRYPDGSVSLTRFSIGYGFTRNSLAVALTGTVTPPPQLVLDADLSDEIGFGVLLPSNSSLAFRLDLIPIPGPIPVVPAGEFALDLRTPGLPGIGIRGCEPVWDGLQLKVPGFIHLGFKQAAVSPMFGILPALNARFDGDLELGNEHTGLTVVCDDLLWIAGVCMPPIPIPALFDPWAPYFENLCLNVRLLGFRLNIGVQRPFPTPNPLVVFDVLALISDPTRPVNPNGPLANMVRVALRDTSLAIPEWLQAMVPGSRQALRNPINVELDLSTVITIVQWIVATVQTAIDAVEAAFEAGKQAVRSLSAPPPDVSELLALLPEQFRVVSADFNFAGFHARGAIALTSIHKVLAPARQRQPGHQPPSTRRDDGIPPQAKQTSAGQRADIKPAVIGRRPSVAPFDQFAEADFAALPVPPRGADGVLIAAELTLFEVARFASVGYVSDTGHFALVSTAQMRDGILRIANIDVPLPLKLSGRAQLQGRVAPNEVRAALTVSGFGEWEPIPGLARLSFGTTKKPVEVMLSTDGRFRLKGSGGAELFGGAAQLNGSVDVSEAHVAVSGSLSLTMARQGSNQPWVEMNPRGSLSIGLGPRFRFEGDGALRLLGRDLASAHFRVTEHDIEIAGKVDTLALMLAGMQLQVLASVSGRAQLDSGGLRRLELEGAGSVNFGGPSLNVGATVEGHVGFVVNRTRLQVSAAGEMSWMGQTWLAAKGSVATDGVISLAGRTSLAVYLTPSELPGGIQLARLFMRLDASASVKIDPAGDLGEYHFKLDWSVGVQLPGASGQTFVLAMQKAKIDGEGSLEFVLLNVTGITFVPGVGDIRIPVPTLNPGDYKSLYKVSIDALVLDQLRFLATSGMVNTIKDIVGSGNVTSTEIFEIPTSFEPGIEMMSLNEISHALAFSISLIWRTNGLALKIRRTGTPPVIIGFNEIN